MFLKNKLLSVLILLNLLFFGAIYYLLMGDKKTSIETANDTEVIQLNDTSEMVEQTYTGEDSTQTAVTMVTADAQNTSIQSAETVRGITAYNGTNSVANNATQTNTQVETKPETKIETETVKIVYNGNLVRVEETDDQGNQHITISNTLEDMDLDKLGASDTSYLNALEEMKNGSRNEITITKEVADTEVKKVATSSQTETESIDHFNKVDVSSQVTSPTKQLSLVQQIAQIVSDTDKTEPEATSSDYLKTLATESLERANEMRTIKVKRGDSLWVIARRAYGSGFEYPRIFKANPHLTDPDKIKVGTLLRVPL
ncbi:MAG: LysM peptidoglycan-binding domain-containing protein [Gammaproteobacteria bacterium]